MQISLYVFIFAVLIENRTKEGTYYLFTLFGALAVGLITKKFLGRAGAAGNITALLLAMGCIASKSYRIDALWIIGAMFFAILHILEAFAWYHTLKNKI